MFDALSTAPGGWDYTNLTAVELPAPRWRACSSSMSIRREAFGITVIPHFASDELSANSAAAAT
jgi:2-methylcitrate dehydratase